MKVEHLKELLPQNIRKPLGVARRRLRAWPSRTQRQKEKLLASNGLAPYERALLARIDSRISHEDGMYAGDGEKYFRVGLSAIHCIDEALSHAQVGAIRRTLDLPCGGGRVSRFLVARFPEAELTACDLHRGMTDFCGKEFGATAVYSKQNLQELSFTDPFDLIWCGSLATHQDANGIRALLELFARSLSPGGLAVFTTHGEGGIEKMREGELDYGISNEQKERVIASYQVGGYGFTNYSNVESYEVSEGASYGVSLTSSGWFRELVSETGGLREVYFNERGWDDHQDVFGLVKTV